MGGISAVPGRGRKAKPQEQKRAAGNPGKRPLNNNAPDFTDVIDIEVPEYMQGMLYAAQMWESIVPELLKNKIIKITDMHIVEGFCTAYQNYRDAQDVVRDKGPVVVGAMGGPLKNPALTIVNETMKQMASYGAMLGLDPSSRQRLIGGGQKKKGNSFAGVLDM